MQRPLDRSSLDLALRSLAIRLKENQAGMVEIVVLKRVLKELGYENVADRL